MIQAQTAVTSTDFQNIAILDEEGFLIDAYAWSRDFSRQQAQQEGLQLNDQHWELIELLREKYLTLGSLPPMRTVCKHVGFDKAELKAQFGSCLRLWKLAGLPNPGEEAIAYMN